MYVMSSAARCSIFCSKTCSSHCLTASMRQRYSYPAEEVAPLFAGVERNGSAPVLDDRPTLDEGLFMDALDWVLVDVVGFAGVFITGLLLGDLRLSRKLLRAQAGVSSGSKLGLLMVMLVFDGLSETSSCFSRLLPKSSNPRRERLDPSERVGVLKADTVTSGFSKRERKSAVLVGLEAAIS